jgi:hypothetical protein
MLFDGKLDAIDLMAIEYYEEQERQEKLEYIVRAIRESDEEVVDINPICNNLKIKLTSDELYWILEQVNED